jgi:hypothetical protein
MRNRNDIKNKSKKNTDKNLKNSENKDKNKKIKEFRMTQKR